MAAILTVATAGLRQDQLADSGHIRYPRVDYLELSHLIDTEILNYTVYDHSPLGKLLRYLETQLRSDLYLTMLGLWLQRSHQLIFAMSERAGIPFAALNKHLPYKRPLVAMFQCWSNRQEQMIKKFDLFSSIDQIIVHCQSMKDQFITLGAKPEQIHVIHYSRDHRFFAPMPEVQQRKNFVLSVGETRSRNYAALFDAVKPLSSLDLLVAASGGWDAREKNTSLQSFIPENTSIVQRLPLLELRNLYAQSQFVVVPVHDTVFSAGSTVVLESMSMGRAVVAFRSRGIADYIIDGETGLLVEPNNPAALRDAIQYLLSHPEEAQRLGQNARQRVEEEFNLDIYVNRMAELIKRTAEASCSTKHPLPGSTVKDDFVDHILLENTLSSGGKECHT
ncbi:MAG: glycosyltransferase family 4 protein [Anaerolineae bacterium]|nr:glycosyltransferase family 4 protein [Anaerolineae bacterium]